MVLVVSAIHFTLLQFTEVIDSLERDHPSIEDLLKVIGVYVVLKACCLAPPFCTVFN